MIGELRVLDLGVIADATIPLGPGLSVITGETGAGKTMLLTGLHLLLGGRADPTTVRPGATDAAVEGRLVLTSDRARRIADDAGALVEDGEVLVVRTVAAAGRSRAHLGGRSVPLGILAELGEELVTVHGQSDQVRLRSSTQQRAALDEFAGAPAADALTALAVLHRQRADLEVEVAQWDARAAAREHEIATLTAAVTAIETLDPQPGEDSSLRARTDRLENVELLQSAAVRGREALDSDDGGALAALESARRALATGADHDPALASASDRVSEALALINDLVTDIGSYASGLEADPALLNSLHERRAAIADLVRDHGDPAAADPVQSVLDVVVAAKERLSSLTAPGQDRDSVQQRLDEATVRERDAAARLTDIRSEAALRLQQAVDAELAGLSMAQAHLHVDVSPRAEIGATGADDVTFMLSAYPGAPARPIGRSASGGELSRIMLALEVALAQQRAGRGPLPSFVFDEVDAGVGGRAAVEVGRRLADLAEHTQVIVVTHLAQVAAFAGLHLVVRRSEDVSVARTLVAPVTGREREAELARMLSGADSQTARQHAAELLHERGVRR